MTDQAFAQKYLFEWHEWPPELQVRHEEIGLAGRAALDQGDFHAAALIFESQFRLLVDAQPSGRRIHKGESLHNWGLSLILGGDQEAALRETLAAFVEDSASGAENSPDRQRELDAPAAHNLVYVFGAWGPAIAGVGRRVRGLILDGEELRDPHDLLVDPAIRAAAVSPTGRRPRTIGSLDSPVDRRIFIGGNYHRLASTLRPLAGRLAPDYDGLLAADFPTPEGWGTDETMLPLLTSAQLAVFEISENGGQVEEIAKTPEAMHGPHRMLAVYNASEMEGPGISDGQTPCEAPSLEGPRVRLRRPRGSSPAVSAPGRPSRPPYGGRHEPLKARAKPVQAQQRHCQPEGLLAAGGFEPLRPT